MPLGLTLLILAFRCSAIFALLPANTLLAIRQCSFSRLIATLIAFDPFLSHGAAAGYTQDCLYHWVMKMSVCYTMQPNILEDAAAMA